MSSGASNSCSWPSGVISFILYVAIGVVMNEVEGLRFANLRGFRVKCTDDGDLVRVWVLMLHLKVHWVESAVVVDIL